MKILLWNMTRALGDGIIHSGYPEEIKKLFPDAEIHLFSTKMHSAAYINNTNIDKVYHFRTYNRKKFNVIRTKILMFPLFQIKNLVKARNERYDLILDIESQFRWENFWMIKFISRKSKISKTFAFFRTSSKRTDKDRKYMEKIYSKVYVDESIYQGISEKLNKTVYNKLYISQNVENRAIEFYNTINYNKDLKIVIFNGEGSDKSISENKIVDTINYLLDSRDDILILVLSYVNYYNKYKKIIDIVNNDRFCLTYNTSIEDTFALVKHADLVITLDTAILHIADTFFIPICEIINYNKKDYFPTKPRFSKYEIIESIGIDNLNNFKSENLLNFINNLL